MKAQNFPPRLWDFCSKWSCDVKNKTSSSSFQLEGHTPYEAVTGNTPDISSLTDFDFYEAIWYYEETIQFPDPKRLMGCWLGEAHNIGQAMCYWVLPRTGIPIVRSTVQTITEDQKTMDSFKEEL
jgi:hypothetical protein